MMSRQLTPSSASPPGAAPGDAPDHSVERHGLYVAADRDLHVTGAVAARAEGRPWARPWKSSRPRNGHAGEQVEVLEIGQRASGVAFLGRRAGQTDAAAVASSRRSSAPAFPRGARAARPAGGALRDHGGGQPWTMPEPWRRTRVLLQAVVAPLYPSARSAHCWGSRAGPGKEASAGAGSVTLRPGPASGVVLVSVALAAAILAALAASRLRRKFWWSMLRGAGRLRRGGVVATVSSRSGRRRVRLPR